jgi:acyl transferase domain-containing protein/NADPH:quinone reductase-like Zn-dependent oxidoreductase/acyl carrier protein
VSRIPPDRWPQALHGHPRVKERGRSYAWAAGVLDDIWGFDPGVFRISPREAEQIDPQQRLLLELAFEAIEDSGVAPSSLAGSRTGVYVGASALDYSIVGLHDPALTDAYFATGNALSIISNRLSYIFDLHGPSLTIDTACSSSLVALHHACRALSAGDVDAALVGGVNILASPFGFVSFSQATMLSPTGLCHAFSARADGYVRSEGGVVLALKTLERAVADGDRIHAVIRGTSVNSDGRTNGISLPAEAYQADLLRVAYDSAAVEPDEVVYVEAHGTGTQAGDPVEARALGSVLGRARVAPLPIGSIKTNIGHLEPASGLAGMLKAMLALEHDRAPKSLHFEEPNPNIDFAALNLAVTDKSTPLPKRSKPRFTGVSSFGFGGTNAHVILTDPPAARRSRRAAPRYLMLSAQTDAALRALARDYSELLSGVGAGESRRIVAATGRRRERMPERLVLPADPPAELAAALLDVATTGQTPTRGSRGVAVDGDGSIVFVFSGNGAQWPGMGRAAFNGNSVFRDAVREIDAQFAPLAGWSLAEELASPDPIVDISRTKFAQPLIFAVQAASVRALAAIGVRPSMTMGHSVGEVAAAEAAGVLTLSDAVDIVFHRSLHQELTRDAGGMTVVFGPREAAVGLVGEFPNLAVAAHNSHNCIVVAGPSEALEALAVRAVKLKLRARRLDLAYPFHTPLMEPVRAPFMRSLKELAPRQGSVPFLSTIADRILAGADADVNYWWSNVREPVLFHEGIERAIGLGKRIFLEIGPRATLRGHMRDAIDHVDIAAFVDVALDEKSEEASGDPFDMAARRLSSAGAEVDPDHLFGPDPGAGVTLPAYPWRRAPYRFGETTEATGVYNPRWRHPLVGARNNVASLEWRTILDPELEPVLADHRVDGQTLLPGAAFVEMALAVARDWKGGDAVSLVGFEILQPLIFTPNASREILCRVSSSNASLEILSRPRLSKTAFVVHARGAVVQQPGPIVAVATPGALQAGEDAAALYERARRVGLEFGPSFRRLGRAERIAADAIEVELTRGAGDSRMGLDPARLDSCFHGLILLFEDFDARSGAYLPVRFEEVRLLKPGAPLSRASLRIRRADARVIVADFDLFDELGELVAVLRGARYQATRSRAGGALSQIGLVRKWVVGTAEISGARTGIETATRAHGAPAPGAPPPADAMLIEGWATAAAFQLARDLSLDGVVDLDSLLLTGRLPAEHRRWAGTVLTGLEVSGLSIRTGGSHRLAEQAMPSPEAAFAEIAAQYPHRAPELLLAANMGAVLREFGAGRAGLSPAPEAARAAFELRSPGATAAAAALGARLDEIARSRRDRKALRVLLVGHGPATARLARFAALRGARLTVFEADARRLERARLSLGQIAETSFRGDFEALADEGFDLVVSAGGLTALRIRQGAMTLLAGKLAPGAELIAIEPEPSLFQDLVFGLREDWFGEDGQRLLGVEAWNSLVTRAGLARVEVASIATDAGRAVEIVARSALARAPRPYPAPGSAGAILILRDPAGTDPIALALRAALSSRGATCQLADARETSKGVAGRAAKLVWLGGETKGDAVARVAAHCLALKDLASALGAGKHELFAVLDVSDRPVVDAVSSFLRTLANETPALDIHRIEIATRAPDLADRLAHVILSGTEETDIAIGDEVLEVLRFAVPDLAEPAPDASVSRASRLEKAPEGGLDRLNWRSVARVAPGPREVEVEVLATGLNFRDVMWALSILPDEMLEDGFAGATLGLEFSGRVVAVGAEIGHLRVGDDVVGLSGGAFSTHVTVDADHVAVLPPELSREAAATVPVAFLTAYYALITCAGLRPGEWVLIHGGAGGVGLAALQIAQWRGARAIVTAGSPEKRDLALALGAEYAFDSRSGAFVDDARRATEGRGVDVVLNSLAGEAMERSLGLLRPFGRFVELGKRDYLANTPVGLRPFRRNLSYFGVDLDQLLLARPDLSRTLFADVLALFATGDLAPPPYTVFESTEVVEAMRLMQQSGHIGKILVRPPTADAASIQKRVDFKVDPTRTHLITGGLGGFGVEAALWLADRGARHIVLLGRSGARSEAALNAVARLRERGVEVRVEARDVADPEAMRALFADLKASMPPIAGIMHAAMTLDDAIIANLSERRLLDVLRPKIAGAEILDALSRDLKLDYFLLFSSATTLFGNPGQGAYVAANGYLEGLARRRIEAGLPALAISWGAIADVGVLARASATRDSLAARVGVSGIKARPALDLMAEAASYAGGPCGDGVIAIADVNWATARWTLNLLESPSYARLLTGEGAADAPARNTVDLRELAARLPPEQARREVADIVVEELARILRLPREDVSKTKPLSEIGLDSLMAVELMLSLETRFGLDTPLGGAAGGLNVMELAGHAIASQVADGGSFGTAESLAAAHLDGAERAEVDELIGALREKGVVSNMGVGQQRAAAK